jgi:hypothetical protein
MERRQLDAMLTKLWGEAKSIETVSRIQGNCPDQMPPQVNLHAIDMNERSGALPAPGNARSALFSSGEL